MRQYEIYLKDGTVILSSNYVTNAEGFVIIMDGKLHSGSHSSVGDYLKTLGRTSIPNSSIVFITETSTT